MTTFWFPKYIVQPDENSPLLACYISYGFIRKKHERVYIGESVKELLDSVHRHARLNNVKFIHVHWEGPKDYNEFGLKLIREDQVPPMPKCKPPKKSNKQEALERISYLRKELESSRDALITHSKNMAESSILTGKPTVPCMTCFDNFDRICREIENKIESL